jgi:hypothetical protein
LSFPEICGMVERDDLPTALPYGPCAGGSDMRLGTNCARRWRRTTGRLPDCGCAYFAGYGGIAATL